jgi:hypothetical protein
MLFYRFISENLAAYQMAASAIEAALAEETPPEASSGTS